MDIFRKKSRLERLKDRYRALMKKSFKKSLKNPEESEAVHREADKIYEEIKYLSMQQGHS